mmetsp:Transcript_50120/g.152457  ORF Transcript_50120/g.152457 Transcript_50120/m.152457 type:complete len:439 (+) Transcript_50120:651-1967(+)
MINTGMSELPAVAIPDVDQRCVSQVEADEHADGNHIPKHSEGHTSGEQGGDGANDTSATEVSPVAVLLAECRRQQAVLRHGCHELRLRQVPEQAHQRQQQELAYVNDVGNHPAARLREGLLERDALHGSWQHRRERELRRGGDQGGADKGSDERAGHRLRRPDGLGSHAAHLVEADKTEIQHGARGDHAAETHRGKGPDGLEHVAGPASEACTDDEHGQHDFGNGHGVDHNLAHAQAHEQHEMASDCEQAGQRVEVVVRGGITPGRMHGTTVEACHPPHARHAINFRRPCPRHASGGGGVLQGEAHGADHPGQLAQAMVAENIARPFGGQPRRQLHVREGGEQADPARDEPRQRGRGACYGQRFARQDEHAAADGATDADAKQVKKLELRPATILVPCRLRQDRLHRLAGVEHAATEPRQAADWFGSHPAKLGGAQRS